jgi:hypothetical protein
MSIRGIFQQGTALAIGGFMTLLAASASANNVEVLREGALVTVFGDNASNQIIVAQNLAGDVTVTGRNGTLVNGLPSVRLARVALEQMEIRMEGGNDIVTVSGLNVSNDLYVNLGDGSDRLLTGAVANRIGAHLTVEGGNGNEIVRLTNWFVGGDCYVDGQIGSLNAVFSRLDVGFALTAISDAANDIISVTGCIVGGMTSVETKGGADRVTVTDYMGFGLFANTDMGNDVVTMDGVATLEDIGVFTGTQNDTVDFLNVSSGTNVIVALDEGSDVFEGTNVTAVYDAVFEGGAGTDVFADFGVAGGNKTEVKEFEIFP